METIEDIVRELRSEPLAENGAKPWLHYLADRIEAAHKESEEKREKRYEYSYRFLDGDVAADHRENPRMVFGDPVHGRVLVRREVGEWEEVKE